MRGPSVDDGEHNICCTGSDGRSAIGGDAGFARVLPDTLLVRRGVNYRPPDTSRMAPVTYEASPESSHRIAAATSSGWPPLCIGVSFFTLSTRSGSPPF